MSTTRETTTSLQRKLALAAGAASLTLASGTIAEAAIVASPSTPIGPPLTSGSVGFDIDGNGFNDFTLTNSGSSAVMVEFQAGGRVVAPLIGGLAKLAAEFVVGPTMTGVQFFNPAQNFLTLTQSSEIDNDASNGGWQMGVTGFFGFKFSSDVTQSDTFYGWGEMVFDPESSGTAGGGFRITRAYYDDTGAAIKVGDTGNSPVVPEPSTCALALLAAGGVAAYRARRKVNAA